MAASSDAQRRTRHRVASRRTGSASSRPLLRAAGAIGAVLLVLVGAGGHIRPMSQTGPLSRANIALVDTWSPQSGDAAAAAFTTPAPAAYGFDDALHFVLDDLLTVGNKPLTDLIVGANPNLTMDQLLNMASPSTTVDTSMHIHDMLYLLGLDNINVADVVKALGMPVLQPGTSTPTTFDDILDKLQLSNVKLDQILTPLGIPHTQTLYGLVDRFSSVNETLTVLMQRIGPIGDPHTQSVQSALQSIGMGGYYNGWFTGCSIFNMGLCMLCGGVTGTVEAAMNCVHTEYANADSQHPNITLDPDQTAAYLLTHIYQLVPGTKDADFSKPVGNYTIGQMLGFDGNTTIKQMIDGPTGYEADPNHVGIWINPSVTIGQWQNGIVNGSPSGPPLVTNISGDPFHGFTFHVGTGTDGNTANQLPWYYHTSSSNPNSIVGGGSPVWVNSATSDGGFAPHHPPENNVPGLNVPPVQPLPETTQPLGTTAWGDLLSWINLAPNKSIADVISELWVNDQQLGYYKLGNALMGMVTDPGALTVPNVLDGNTLVSDFMNAIGWGGMTLDEFIGLS